MKSDTNMDGNEFWARLKEALAQHAVDATIYYLEAK